MTKIVACYSTIGGVGKSTLSANLAYLSAVNAAQRTLLWDINGLGSTSLLRAPEHASADTRSEHACPRRKIEPTQWPNLDLLVEDISPASLERGSSTSEGWCRSLPSLASAYDRIVLDCVPHLGKFSEELFRVADLIVVPVHPTPIGLRSLTLIQEHLDRNRDWKPHLLPIISMVDRRSTLHRDFVAAYPDWPVIPQSDIVPRMAMERTPVVAGAGSSLVGKAMRGLWAQVERHLLENPAVAGRRAPIS